MRIDLDVQEREVIKSYAKQMATFFRRETGGGGSRNSLGIDAASVAFWERLVTKMEGPTPNGN